MRSDLPVCRHSTSSKPCHPESPRDEACPPQAAWPSAMNETAMQPPRISRPSPLFVTRSCFFGVRRLDAALPYCNNLRPSVHARFLPLARRGGVTGKQAEGSCIVFACHSEEPCDEESASAFLMWSPPACLRGNVRLVAMSVYPVSPDAEKGRRKGQRFWLADMRHLRFSSGDFSPAMYKCCRREDSAGRGFIPAVRAA